MLEPLIWAGLIVLVVGFFSALDGSRDVLHPMVLIAPIMAFIYWWMPLRLLATGGLSRFFEPDQLVFVQCLTLAGITAFVCGCLAAGVRVTRPSAGLSLTAEACRRLRIGGTVVGSIGLVCWLVTIANSGGFIVAFSKSYGGGWDENGYVRDGTLLILVGVLLLVSAIASEGIKITSVLLLALFVIPWTVQALLTARRGPTFAIAIVTAVGWYLHRNRRPPAVAAVFTGLVLGWLVLFLVTNRNSIYIGSDFNMKTDVAGEAATANNGNEYIYGAGAVISAERRNHYYWMRRYLAQVLIRPIPSSVWATKYEDFGVPELRHNGGTSEGFRDVLGWAGAPGGAPGIVADLFMEIWWLAVPAMAVLGWLYGRVWRRAVLLGGAWASQYAIFAALSIYLIMQTMEAVIFRSILLSIPCWIVWRWALAKTRDEEFSVGLVGGVVSEDAVQG